jgi:hypothetical protein
MRHERLTRLEKPGTDWKALGYLVSIASVLFLGSIAWPQPDDPAWHMPFLILGMAASVIGMGCRYKAHLDQKRELRRTKNEAERAKDRKASRHG